MTTPHRVIIITPAAKFIIALEVAFLVGFIAWKFAAPPVGIALGSATLLLYLCGAWSYFARRVLGLTRH